MKTNSELHNGTLIITSLDNNYEAKIDVQTGETVFDYAECTIDDLHRFVNAARTRYRKFLSSKEIESFKFD
ncbi:hypothetical protein CPT_Moonbeam109 [Bacillus phage Moonbeam]|uniref:Uncharacterized protein n=1 Tax=Bacillus phage Moonbeam TaxID=1540091 RepID=A0A0A0RND9_9CAUD|nr:hypothetical protein CPT_Moonbeam109 [Bacillus phage Moonbeam]AIW03507.1 hypothetical protein CPT_Moonbeam109 [Bacillus phage Moonbeam]